MTSSLTLILFCLLFFRRETAALQVTPGSTCAAICLDAPEGDVRDPAASSTNSSDIVCNDEEYTTTASGIRFKSCVECLQESHAVSGEENDISWYLYNLRYSVDVCLYSFPNTSNSKAISSPCDIDYGCRPLRKALEAGSLNSDNGTQLDYCTADGGAFSGSQLHDCIQCFRSSSSQFYMSNFLTALQAGCEQKPQAGNLIGLSGSLFTQFQVNITAAPQNQTASSNNTSNTTMTTGAIVGIVVGATLLLLGGLGLFWAYHRKQKYYGDRLDSAHGRKSITPPLVGGYPHYYEGKNNSLPADWELRAQQLHTNNAEYYEKTEMSTQGGQQPGYAYNPGYPGYQTAYGPHSTLPTHPAYMPQVASRSNSRNDTPSPPPVIKSNRPDAYAVNAYLNAAAAPTMISNIPTITTTYIPSGRDSLPTLPPVQPPAQPQQQPHHYHPSAQPPTTIIPRGPTTKPLFPGGAPPPPPPPQAQRAPRLSMPTVPKVRKPTKYAPPSLAIARPVVEDAVPVRSHGYGGGSSDEDRDEVLSIGLEVPERNGHHSSQQWEQESYAGYGSRTGTPPDQLTADRRRKRVTEFTDID
ncbi:hypothetical protein F4818DRAFT_375886 [Hypoxylon cercidicola]|nr:hypothetical protein F4818DRAFT_375886 [Hypoxylon cercidicola]